MVVQAKYKLSSFGFVGIQVRSFFLQILDHYFGHSNADGEHECGEDVVDWLVGAGGFIQHFVPSIPN